MRVNLPNKAWCWTVPVASGLAESSRQLQQGVGDARCIREQRGSLRPPNGRTAPSEAGPTSVVLQPCTLRPDSPAQAYGVGIQCGPCDRARRFRHHVRPSMGREGWGGGQRNPQVEKWR